MKKSHINMYTYFIQCVTNQAYILPDQGTSSYRAKVHTKKAISSDLPATIKKTARVSSFAGFIGSKKTVEFHFHSKYFRFLFIFRC